MAMALVAIAVAPAFVGCGSDSKDDSSTGAEAVATAPSSTTTSTTTVPADVTPAETTTSGEDQPGGAGDEEGITVQVALLIDAGKVTPAVSKVPASVPIELVVASTEGIDRRLTVDTKGSAKKVFKVKALAHRTYHLSGLAKGDHQMYLDGKPAAKLTIGS